MTVLELFCNGAVPRGYRAATQAAATDEVYKLGEYSLMKFLVKQSLAVGLVLSSLAVGAVFSESDAHVGTDRMGRVLNDQSRYAYRYSGDNVLDRLGRVLRDRTYYDPYNRRYRQVGWNPPGPPPHAAVWQKYDQKHRRWHEKHDRRYRREHRRWHHQYHGD